MGGAVAKALASAGAQVFLTGLNPGSLRKVADEIIAAGGHAAADQVDALDEKAIKTHLEKVADKADSVDISFNALGEDVVQNIPLVDIAADDFVRPITF